MIGLQGNYEMSTRAGRGTRVLESPTSRAGVHFVGLLKLRTCSIRVHPRGLPGPEKSDSFQL